MAGEVKQIGPDAPGTRTSLPHIDLNGCLEVLKNVRSTRTLQRTELGISGYLYCKDLLVAQFPPEDNLSRVCIDTTLANRFLHSNQIVKNNSFGYPVDDKSYVDSNIDRLALEKVLPAFFNQQSSSADERAQGEALFMGLFERENLKKSYREIQKRIDENNANPDAQERVYVANYETAVLLDDSSDASNTMRRLAFMSVRKDCTSFVNMVPNDSTPGLRKSAVAAHVVCDSSSLNRADGKTRQGVWFYSWRKTEEMPFHFMSESQVDDNCLRCHSGRSTFAALDVNDEFPLDEHTKQFMKAIYDRDSRFMKPADFLMSLWTGDKAIQVSMPKDHALDGAMSFDIKSGDAARALFQANGGISGCDGKLAGEAGFQELMRCSTCHGSLDQKISGPLYRANRAILIESMMNPQHPYFRAHNANDNFSNAYTCVSDQLKRNHPLRQHLEQASLETHCAAVKAKPELAWIFH